MTYTIYHIPEKQKIGITYRDPKVRVREQGYREFEILEVHTDYDLASDRELELQQQYGYKKDKAKYNLHTLSANGKINGAINGKLNKGRKRKLKYPHVSVNHKPKLKKIKTNLLYNQAFTEDEVRFIRTSDLRQNVLSQMFNVSQVTIHNVKKHKLYNWVK